MSSLVPCTVLVCQGVHDQLEVAERLLTAAARDDRGWDRVGTLVQPGIRRVRGAAAAVTEAAAHCAVAAVLGPARA